MTDFRAENYGKFLATVSDNFIINVFFFSHVYLVFTTKITTEYQYRALDFNTRASCLVSMSSPSVTGDFFFGIGLLGSRNIFSLLYWSISTKALYFS